MDIGANRTVAPWDEPVRISKRRRVWVPDFKTILDLRCFNGTSDDLDSRFMVLYFL